MPTMTRKENLIRTIRRDEPAWVPYRYDGGLPTLNPNVIARPVEGGLDDWGTQWIPGGTEEGSYPSEKPVCRLAEAGLLESPQTDWQMVTAELRQQMAGGQYADSLVIVRNELVLFERVKYLLGTTEYLMGFMTNPDEVHVLLDQVLVYQKELTRCIMEAGADGVRFTDDWGIQNSLYINPTQWREFLKPRMKELYAIVKEYDGFVFQHSCGHIDEIIPDLIEIGLDVVDPCQPMANDVFGWKERYGDSLTFMGGLDTQTYLSFGTPQEVKQAVKEVVSIMSRAGGYIAAPSHTISIPEANRQAMIEALQEWNDSTASPS